METRLMRFLLPALALVMMSGGPVLADGRCDLNGMLGYQIVAAKPIDGYIQGSIRHKGYEGCEEDRVLVFADNTGVRCKSLVRQKVEGLPTGYLFARGNLGDMKLCVEGEMFDVSQTN